jgi:hypothetical protein
MQVDLSDPRTLFIIAIIMAVLALVASVLILRFWGIFRFPFYVWFTIMLTMMTAMFETFGVLPYDISTSMTGRTDPSISSILSGCANGCYWVGFLMGWFIMPLFVCTFMYRYATSFKRAFYYSLRYNIVWYIIAGIICGGGLIALIALKLFNLRNLVSLCISLTNSYGTLLVVMGLGNAIIEMPRQLFKFASPTRKLRTLLNRLNMIADCSAEASVNAKECVDVCYRCRQTMNPEFQDEVLPVFTPRLTKLEEQCHNRVLPSHLYERKPNPKLTELANKNYSAAPIDDFETVMYWADDCLTAMDEFYFDVDAVATECEASMRLFIADKSGDFKPRVRSLLMYALWGVLVFFNLCICWGELTLVIGHVEYGPFHFLGHLDLGSFSLMMFVVTPVILYVVFLGAWAMTWVHAGKQFYRFVPHHTNENTVYYWNLAFSRLSCASIYNLLLQMDAIDCQTFLVYGHMDDIWAFGLMGWYNRLMPALMFLVMLLVATNCYPKCAEALDCITMHVNPEDFSVGEITASLEILRAVRPDLADLIEHPMIRGLGMESPLLSAPLKSIDEPSLSSALGRQRRDDYF